MTVRSPTTLKTYFEAGDVPSQAQFADLIDSCVNVETSAAQALNCNMTINGNLTVTGTVSATNQQSTVGAAACMAHVYNNSGTPVSGGKCVNVAGYTDHGTGDWTITCTTSIATDGNNTTWNATPYSGTGAKLMTTVGAFGPKSVRIRVYNDAGTATDPDRLFVNGYSTEA